MNPLSSPTGSWGQKVTGNGGPQFGALILSEVLIFVWGWVAQSRANCSLFGQGGGSG